MSPGFVVAVVALKGNADSAVPVLAPALGTTAYELKLTLAAGFPAIVRLTVDAAEARAAYDALVRGGHRALLVAKEDVVAASAMTLLRDFQLGPTELSPTSSGGAAVPYSDLLALVRASHRTTTETTTEVKERKFRPGAAIATGGLVISKTVTKEVTTRTDDREPVLYLFRRSGLPPLLLRQNQARYAGLGAAAGPTAIANFGATVKRLRELAPGATYDERLLQGRAVRGIPDPILSTDLLAHLVALSLSV